MRTRQKMAGAKDHPHTSFRTRSSITYRVQRSSNSQSNSLNDENSAPEYPNRQVWEKWTTSVRRLLAAGICRSTKSQLRCIFSSTGNRQVTILSFIRMIHCTCFAINYRSADLTHHFTIHSRTFTLQIRQLVEIRNNIAQGARQTLGSRRVLILRTKNH